METMINLTLDSAENEPLYTNGFVSLNVAEQGLGAHITATHLRMGNDITGANVSFRAEGKDGQLISGGTIKVTDAAHGKFDIIWPSMLTDVSSPIGKPFMGQFTLTKGDVKDVLSPILIMVRPVIGVYEKYGATFDEIDAMIKQALNDLSMTTDTVNGQLETLSGKVVTLTTAVDTVQAKLDKIVADATTATSKANTATSDANAATAAAKTATTNATTAATNAQAMADDIKNNPDKYRGPEGKKGDTGSIAGLDTLLQPIKANVNTNTADIAELKKTGGSSLRTGGVNLWSNSLATTANNGTIKQTIKLRPGEQTLTVTWFNASTTEMWFYFSGAGTEGLTSDSTPKWANGDLKVFNINIPAYASSVNVVVTTSDPASFKIEYGAIASDYSPSPKDAVAATEGDGINLLIYSGGATLPTLGTISSSKSGSVKVDADGTISASMPTDWVYFGDAFADTGFKPGSTVTLSFTAVTKTGGPFAGGAVRVSYRVNGTYTENSVPYTDWNKLGDNRYKVTITVSDPHMKIGFGSMYWVLGGTGDNLMLSNIMLEHGSVAHPYNNTQFISTLGPRLAAVEALLTKNNIK